MAKFGYVRTCFPLGAAVRLRARKGELRAVRPTFEGERSG